MEHPDGPGAEVVEQGRLTRHRATLPQRPTIAAPSAAKCRIANRVLRDVGLSNDYHTRGATPSSGA